MNAQKCAVPFLWLLSLAVLGTARAETGNVVEAMCLDRDRSAAVCGCAAKRLRAEVGEADYALYEAVGRVYRRQLEQGKGRGEAWDAGVEAAAGERGTGKTAILQRTNAIGREHRQAMQDCR